MQPIEHIQFTYYVEYFVTFQIMLLFGTIVMEVTQPNLFYQPNTFEWQKYRNQGNHILMYWYVCIRFPLD